MYLSYVTASFAPHCNFVLYHEHNVCKGFRCQGSFLLYFIESQVLEKQSCTEHFNKFV